MARYTTLGHRSGVIASTSARYHTLWNSASSSATGNDASARTYIPPNTEITIRSMDIELLTAPGGADTATVTLVKNSSDTALSVVITGAETTASVSSDVTATDADHLTIKIVLSTSSVGADFNFRVTYDTVDGPQVYSANISGSLGSSTAYLPLTGRGAVLATAGEAEEIIPVAGTIDGGYFALTAAPGAGDSRTATLVKNGSDTALVLAITETDTTVSASGAAVDVAAGDTLYWRLDYSGTPAAATGGVSFSFLPDVEGEGFIATKATATLPPTGATRYSNVHGWGLSGTTAESSVDYVTTCAATLSNLYVKTQNSPGSGGDAYTYTLRSDLADTALTCSIADAATTGSDTSNSVSVSSGDILTMKGAPINAPTNTSGYVAFSMKMVVPQPSTWTPKTIIF